jgi:hypothetical protein
VAVFLLVGPVDLGVFLKTTLFAERYSNNRYESVNAVLFNLALIIEFRILLGNVLILLECLKVIDEIHGALGG